MNKFNCKALDWFILDTYLEVKNKENDTERRWRHY